MNNLQVIVHDNRRVLTTKQIADSYGATTNQISKNFNRNIENYEKGKHFIILQGDEKREFLNRGQIDDGSQNAQNLYLWTDKGALLHAKSLNTPLAWKAYDMLIDEYYNLVEEKKNISAIDQMLVMMKAIEETNNLNLENKKEIENVKLEVSELKDDMRITTTQELKITSNVHIVVINALGGSKANSYKELSRKAYSEFWRQFKQHFSISRKGDLPKIKFEQALRFIELWSPSTSLKLEIELVNSQMNLVL